MAMGDDHKIQLREVDTLGSNVVRKDFGIIAGIKQDALAAIFNKGGKPPVLRHIGVLPEGIVEGRDLCRVSLCVRWWRATHPESHCSQYSREQTARDCR